jgi:hypothetical protein
MKKTILILATILLVLGTSSSWAQEAPKVAINLSFDKTSYNSTEPIVATVTVTNNGAELLVNEGFQTTVFWRELKITDPAGRVLGFKHTTTPESHGMYPVTQMLNWSDYWGRPVPVPVSRCELLASGSLPVSSGDIRSRFDFSLPGRYMAQAQVSVMVYKTQMPAPDTGWCQLDDYLWQGGLESQVVSFYVEGNTRVEMVPADWLMNATSSDVVKVRIYPDAGLSVKHYAENVIFLNTVASTNVTNRGTYLEASYNAYEALRSLGEGVEAGQQYPVRISGWMRDGGFFGGTGRVMLTSVYTFDGFFSPIDNQRINSVKAGQAVPVKWRIRYAGGTVVSTPSSFQGLSSYNIGCDTFAGEQDSAIPEYSAGNSGVQYLGDGYWQFNWKTPKSYANTCRTMVLELKDGSIHTVNFKFK